MIERNFLSQDLLSDNDIEGIHEASMDLLENNGIEILHEEAREIFAENGAKVEGKTVYLPRQVVEDALEKAPSSFTLHARNSNNNVIVGGDNSVLAPGYGSPYVTDIEKGRRDSTFEDYINFTKLAADSDNIDVLGGVIVEPTDVRDEIRHAKMLYAAAKNSDKCLMGSALGAKKALDSFKMASMLFGEDEIIDDKSIVISLISTMSPLQYDERMLDALIEHAKYNQATVVASLIMSGSTGPMSIAGTLTLQNVEVLTGIVLSQLINPGAPVVYGSATTIMDMKTSNIAVGSPEYSKFIGATSQLARYYNLPCRAGGTITDSLMPDVQAGYESMMSFKSTINHGVNFVLHSAGLLENYMTMSYEKFIIDDEIISNVTNYQSGINVNKESIAKEVIEEVGPAGHYLTESHTMKHMKDFEQPEVGNRDVYSSEDDIVPAVDRAHEICKERLDNFEAPELDPAIDEKLTDYIDSL